ncbi:zinc finger CCCH domain-containing protein 18-like [Limulus polyphemus]|uniref:Zinc finger CCCH domain-containing protein 18-like n=1 Tax=Limulus polyphemus TaxID=6850 RepID=A0ABM1RYZ0_LIMPO|nr:zinc finger CCCH domain-containing protein 18-like [Limulus polyphemus]
MTYKEQERIRQRNMMKLKRQDPLFRAVEREKQCFRMKARRQDPTFRDIERERQRQRMRLKRQDPMFRERERERQKYRMQLKRQDPAFKEEEKARCRSRSQTKRINTTTVKDCENSNRNNFASCSQLSELTHHKAVIGHEQKVTKLKSGIGSTNEYSQQIYRSVSPGGTKDGSCKLQTTSMGRTTWNSPSQYQNKDFASDRMPLGYYRSTAPHSISSSSLSCLLRTSSSSKTLPDISSITLHSSLALHSKKFQGELFDHQSSSPNVASVMNSLFQSYMPETDCFVKDKQLLQQKSQPQGDNSKHCEEGSNL